MYVICAKECFWFCLIDNMHKKIARKYISCILQWEGLIADVCLSDSMRSFSLLFMQWLPVANCSFING